ncbi:hypothetical protein CAP35_01255 [Chitinophagaceae bacterium IBVUCB1]|nr:hypothetical protein CAP35_01255 [Chitinophagaceae bacterium IBVUCB1]
MSSTNRTAIRHDNDYYVTPLQTVADFFSVFRLLEPTFCLAEAHILDPSAGGDANSPMPYPSYLSSIGNRTVTTLDIRRDSKAAIKKDYLQWKSQRKFDAVITNPPFHAAIAFIQKALSEVRPGGFVCMLLRLNFLGSLKRKSFWLQYMPKWIIVHARRPSFVKGGNDSVEYAHIVWQKEYMPEHSRLVIILLRTVKNDATHSY